MFASPITVPHEVLTNIVMNRINGPEAYGSEYSAKGALHDVRMRIRHSKTKGTSSKPAMDRHNVEVVQTIHAVGDVPAFDRKVYIVIELKPDDNDVALADSLCDWLVSGTVLEDLNAWRS